MAFQPRIERRPQCRLGAGIEVGRGLEGNLTATLVFKPYCTPQEAARRSFLAADSSKLGRTAPVRLASLAEFDLWATDAPPPEALAALCARGRTEIALPGPADDRAPLPSGPRAR